MTTEIENLAAQLTATDEQHETESWCAKHTTAQVGGAYDDYAPEYGALR